MRKKLVGAAVVAGVVLVGMVLQQRQAASPPAPAVAPVSKPVPSTAAAPALAQETKPDPAPYLGPEPGEVTQALMGEDFSLRVMVAGNDNLRDLEIVMEDGKPVRGYRALGAEPGELSNVTFDKAEEFALVRLLPGEAREQIVSTGDQWLMRGEGTLGRYTVYRIAGEQLQEIFSVITAREREEINRPPALELEARVEQTTRDGQPAFVYRVKAGGEAERAIVFVWNGERFDDPSGEYAKIEEQYAP